MRIGIDIGGTSTRGVALTASGEIALEAGRPTEYGDAGVEQSVLCVVRELVSGMGRDSTEIGIGVPGLVDYETGEVHHAANLGIAHLPLARLVSRATHARVTLDNDVNAAALSALHFAHPEKDKAPRSFAYINIGTGLGVGLVVDGRILHGRSGHAGELGHFPLGLTDRDCGCGQRGCIETSTSGSALQRFAPDRGPDMPLPEDFLAGLVALLRMTTLATDPDSIVLGGGVVLNHDGFREQVVRALNEHDVPGSFLSHLAIARRISIAPTSHLGALGAALLCGPITTAQKVSRG